VWACQPYPAFYCQCGVTLIVLPPLAVTVHDTVPPGGCPPGKETVQAVSVDSTFPVLEPVWGLNVSTTVDPLSTLPEQSAWASPQLIPLRYGPHVRFWAVTVPPAPSLLPPLLTMIV
jgi:hypothetical protein